MPEDPTQVVNPDTTPQAGANTDPGTVTDPQGGEKTYSEKYVQQLRAEAASARVKNKEMEERLQQLEDAQKTEAQRLAEKAARADTLETEAKRLRETLSTQVEAMKADLPEAMRNLVPEGDAAAQLDWIRKAKEAAAALVPTPNNPALPPAGGRNPGGAADANADKIKTEEALHTYPALRRRQMR